jgi:ferritin-like metal-binding protein YciE
MHVTSLDKLFEIKLRQALDIEEQVADAAPHLAREVRNEQLRNALEQHIRQSAQHITRLRQMMANRGIEAKRQECISVRALLRETQTMLDQVVDPDTRDAFIIGAQQAIEHHEIAAYGTMRTWAQQLGYSEEATVLQRTLDEEGHADEMLTAIAEQIVNPQAAQNGEREIVIPSNAHSDRSRSTEPGRDDRLSGVVAERGADMR